MKKTDFSVFELLDTPVMVVSLDDGVVFANQQCRALCAPHDFSGDWLNGVSAADRPRVSAAWRLSIDKNVPFSCEFRLADKQGGELWVHARGRPPQDEQGRLWVLSLGDVSAYKFVERELLARESLLERVFANRHVAIACLDPDFNFIRVNSAYAEADEKSVDFFPGKNHFDLYPSEENRQLFRQVLDSGEPHLAWARAFEYADSPDRGVTHWDWSLWPIRAPEGFVSQLLLVLVDVTRRVRAEQELARRDVMSEAVLQAANALLLVMDHRGNILRFNKACERLTGWSQQEMIGRPVWERLIPAEQQDAVREVFASLTEQALPNEYVNEWLTRDGLRRCIHWHNSVLTDEDGKVVSVVSIGIDETEVREAREDSSGNRARFAAIFNAMPDAAIFSGSDRRIVSINRAAEQVFGYREQELLGREGRCLCLNPDEFDSVGQRQSDSTIDSLPLLELECRRKNGEGFWAEVIADRVCDEQGGLLGFVTIVRDVSREREARLGLQQTRLALDAALDAVSFADRDGLITYVNRAFLGLWGYDDEAEVLGRHISSLAAETHIQEGMRALQERGSWVGEMTARRRDGSEVEVRVAAQTSYGLDGLSTGTMASFMDISAQKRVENELQRKEEVLARAQAIANMGSWDWNIQTGELAWSEEIYRLFGRRPNEFPATYEAFLNTIHPDDRQKVIDAVTAAVDHVEVPYDIRHRIVRPDGEERIVHEKGLVYRDEAGTPLHMIGTVHDITRDRQVQEALTRFKTTLDMTLDCVFMFEPDNLRFFYVNQGAMDQVGFGHDEMMLMHPYDIKPDYTEEQFRALVEPMARGEIPVRYFETRHRTRSGRDVPVEIFLQYIRPEGHSPRFVAIVRDISERRKNEAELQQYREHLEELVRERTLELEAAHEQLVRQERLATLGQLTATVSHELRNPLGAIKSSLYILEKIHTDSGDERLWDTLRRMDRNIGRCDHIIDELLDFTRITEISREDHALGPWLRDLLEELDLPAAIQLRLDLPGEDIQASFDASRLRRAVINVVDNACHAMLQEGRTDRYRDGATLCISVATSPRRASLVFRDSGTGMPPEVLEKIFEPLYSTKGFGVGLGMPAVLQIMRQHGGGVEVGLIEGGGTEVQLWLPVTGPRSREEIASDAQAFE